MRSPTATSILASLTLWLASIVAGAGAAHADTAAARPGPMSAGEAAMILGLYSDLVDTAVRHAGACDALAAGVSELVGRRDAALVAMWAASAAQRRLPDEARAKIEQRSRELVAALRGCFDHGPVQAAFARMRPPKRTK
jgi:hypothetical protein